MTVDDAIAGEVVKPERKHVMTLAYAPAGGDWRLFRATSRDIVAVEQRFHDLSAAKIFGDMKFEVMYRVLWLTLRRRGELALDVTLAAFVDSTDITVNVPLRLLEKVDLEQLRDQGLIVGDAGDELGLDDDQPAESEQAGGDGDEPDPTQPAASSAGTSG